MPMEFRQATAADGTAVVSFLKRAFQAGDNEPIVNEGHMRWKLFEAGPDWTGSRSFILTQRESIVAHCGVYPVTFLSPAGKIRGIITLDWASGSVGAGLAVLMKLCAFSETHLVINGTPATRAILDQLRYRRLGEIRTYRLAVRSWQQLRGRLSASSLWDVWRMARRSDVWRKLWNGARSRPVPVMPRSDWSVQRVARFEPHAGPPLPNESFRACTLVERKLDLLNYMLLCPAASFSGFQLYRRGTCKGYFLLSRVSSQARIADLYVDSEDLADWSTAFSLAAAEAMRDRTVCDVTAAASAPFVEAALRAGGFQLSHSGPIFLRDPANALAGVPAPNLSLMDGDMAYL